MGSEKDQIYIISRTIPEDEREQRKKAKKATPAATREAALADIAARLGESKGWNQKANNAFVYYQLPTFTSFGMAFESRMAKLVDIINATIKECTCKEQPCKEHIGRSVIVQGGIFENTNTYTEWAMNFFQQSQSRECVQYSFVPR